ncbi:hypothetical protein CERSUDRAFT_68006 [Gelatoporia subvermispora B]|uniref:carboxypeptidase C n=1 Tax=Ceriporiopsis subvermispora (strain B) TaxID=914234 RepID=M2Q915_CERS8|nr:hypothetical protein CERSUDRAFT_68006 [Gelatoporia subvermispora B]
MPDVVDNGSFEPLGSLSAISTTDFTVLEHPLFPHYSIRVMKSNFCDGTVPTYTGYVDKEARHLFFYFFESRNDPGTDDVIFWTNGGPGASSAMGLFMELGPCRVTSADNPVGVGFSYADHGEHVDNLIDAGQDITAFTLIFFEHFTDFKGWACHMAGESYSGRYLPVFATAIYEQNAKLKAAGLTPINLKSVMIGNGCTHWPTMITPWYDFQCKNISVLPVSGVSSCVHLKQIVGLNVYDITEPCDGPYEETFCYPIVQNITTFLNRADVRRTLGVNSTVANFTMNNDEVALAFWERRDAMSPTQYYIGALLERGIRVLVYVGANDWLCNWVGNERMTLELEWSRQSEFTARALREWEIGGTPAGLTRNAGPFTFATFFGAGHMAPYNKPEESLELMKRWIKGQEL